MSIYEARLQADLEAISRRVDAVGALAVDNVEEAVGALVAGDNLRSYRVGLKDKAINRETRAIDVLCHEFVARHFPAAGHLRFISSALRLDVELERVGDYAVNIARRSVLLHSRPSEANLKTIQKVGATATALLQEAVTAWSMRDAEAARPLIRRSRAFTKAHERKIDALVDPGEGDVEDLFIVRDVLYNLIRVGAQARNLCEETLFTVTGETKEPKTYNVLFVGDGNSRLTHLAEAFGRKAFPKSGQFASAGWAPDAALDPELFELANRAGLDLDGAAPRPLSEELPVLERYHVIVALQPGALDHLGDLPYSTVFLEWFLPEADLAAQFREVSSQVRDLMLALRGPDAN